MTADRDLEAVLRGLRLTGMLDTLEIPSRRSTGGQARPRRVPAGALRGRALPARRGRCRAQAAGGALSEQRRRSRTSTSPTTRRSRPRRSATSPGSSSSRRARGSCCTGRSESARPTSRLPSATSPAGAGTRCCSPPARSCSQSSPAGTPTAASRPACAGSGSRPSSSSMTGGMREFTASQADDVFELLSERVERRRRSLLLTSNRSPADWYPLFPNAVVGESILDRVLNSSHQVLLEGKSYRPVKRPGRRS